MLTNLEMINEVRLRAFIDLNCHKAVSCKCILADILPVNLGKWILRFLFDRLIEEEAKRDAVFREKLLANTSRPNSLRRENAPTTIHLPTTNIENAKDSKFDDDSMITPRPTVNGVVRPAVTPGLIIGTAAPHSNGINPNAPNDPTSTTDEGTSLEKRTSQQSQPRSSIDRKSDYFSPSAQARSPVDGQNKGSITPGDTSLEGTTLASTHSPIDGEKEEKMKETSIFGKGFRMKFPKKIGRSSTDVKPAVVDERSEESDKSEDKEDKTIQDNFFGTIQKIRYDYEERLQSEPSSHLLSSINPSLFNETPKLRLPPYTTVLIQDERPDSGGVADLYRGTVSSVGFDAEVIEKMAPMWLGELILKVLLTLFLFWSALLIIVESNAAQRYTQGFLCPTSLSRSSTEHRQC